MRRVALLGLLVIAAAAGCGGSDSESGSAPTTTGDGEQTLDAPAWAGSLLRKPGPEGALVMATSDFAVGANRVGFLLVREDGSLVTAPTVDLHYGPGKTAVARLVDIGATSTDSEPDEAKAIYVADRVPFAKGGKHWIVAQPRGVAFQGFQVLDVKDEPVAVGVGEKAPASDTPTTATDRAERITTANPPDVELLRYSVKDSVESGTPFVVAFATPAFCQTRTCGPTVDVVEAVRKRFAGSGIRFIHVEIYEDNLPGNGVNRWVREWKLPSEPWVFVVDGKGVVRDRFEGALSVGELTASVRKHLGRS
jgi:hypothetical protein